MSTPDFLMRIGPSEQNPQALEVMIYDAIGAGLGPGGVMAKDIAQALSTGRAASDVVVRINSRGGSVFDAMAIYNSLTQHKGKKTVYIEGVAASSASLIAMAGDEIIMSDNALMMIHDPLTLSGGRAADLRKSAALLDKMRASFVAIYAARTKTPADTIASMMAEETWMDANEALALGFATAIAPGVKAVALDLSCFKNAPVNPNPQSRGEVQPAQSPKEIPMNPDQFKAYIAEHPEAVAGYRTEGQKAGVAEGYAQAKTSLKSILDAAKGDSKLAVDAFLAGKDAEIVAAVITDREAQAAASAKAIADKDAEIAKLKAQVGTQGAVGHVAAESAKAAEPKTSGDSGGDPKAAAKAEWDAMAADAREAWVNEKTFVAFRARELARA
jgi:ATP-dependent Clp protease protease subunit